MDPNASLKLLLEELADGNAAAAVASAGDLLGWILEGGSRPDATPEERRSLELGFARLADRLEVDDGS